MGCWDVAPLGQPALAGAGVTPVAAGPGAAVVAGGVSRPKADFLPGTRQTPLLLQRPLRLSLPPRCQVTLLPRRGDTSPVPRRDPHVQPCRAGGGTCRRPQGCTPWPRNEEQVCTSALGGPSPPSVGAWGSPCPWPHWPRNARLGAEPGGARGQDTAWPPQLRLHSSSGDLGTRLGTRPWGDDLVPAAGGLSVTRQTGPVA